MLVQHGVCSKLSCYQKKPSTLELMNPKEPFQSDALACTILCSDLVSENGSTHVLSLTLFCFLHVSHMAKCSSGPVSPQSVWLSSCRNPGKFAFLCSVTAQMAYFRGDSKQYQSIGITVTASSAVWGPVERCIRTLNMPLVLIRASQGCTIVFSPFAFFWD